MLDLIIVLYYAPIVVSLAFLFFIMPQKEYHND
jgi:hypothetical protein